MCGWFFLSFPAGEHNCFLNDHDIALIDKTDGSGSTRRDNYCRKV